LGTYSADTRSSTSNHDDFALGGVLGERRVEFLGGVSVDLLCELEGESELEGWVSAVGGHREWFRGICEERLRTVVLGEMV
jgi:hypothetical protein